MVSSVAFVSWVVNSWAMCRSQRSLSDCSAGVRRASELCFSFILTAFPLPGFDRRGDPRNYNRSALDQAMLDFFFAARRDGAFHALTLNSTHLRICASR